MRTLMLKNYIKEVKLKLKVLTWWKKKENHLRNQIVLINIFY